MKGTVSKRGKAWRIQWECSDTPGVRRRKRETVHGSKKDAYAKLAQRLA